MFALIGKTVVEVSNQTLAIVSIFNIKNCLRQINQVIIDNHIYKIKDIAPDTCPYYLSFDAVRNNYLKKVCSQGEMGTQNPVNVVFLDSDLSTDNQSKVRANDRRTSRIRSISPRTERMKELEETW